MKKYILYILLFFGILAGIDVGFGKAFDYINIHANKGEYKKLYDVCQNNYYDLVILGSSRACHHYVPDIIADSSGLTCFNAGFDGNGVILSCGILQLILERYKPKCIVFDVEPAFDIEEYAADNNNTRYLALLKPFYKHDCVRRIFYDIAECEYIKQYSGMVRHNSKSIKEVLSFLSNNDKNERNGYIPLSGFMQGHSIQPAEIQRLDYMKISYFNKLLNIARSNNIPIVVVYSPKYERTYKETMDTIVRICSENDVIFWDYSNQKKYMESSLFKEPMHLNDNGAVSFSKEIGSRIKILLNRSSQYND